MELANSPEAAKILKQTFYLCAGVAGAGCTTAVEKIKIMLTTSIAENATVIDKLISNYQIFQL